MNRSPKTSLVVLIIMLFSAALFAACPEYVSTKSYKVGDMVVHKGQGYVCANSCSPWESPSATSWFWDETTECDAGVVQYSLAVSTAGNGSVVLSPAGGTYDAGTVVTATATPSSNCEDFSSWNGNPVNGNTTNSVAITMNADYSVSALFADNGTCVVPVVMCTLSVATAGNGTVTLSPAGGIYEKNTLVTVTATPASSCDSFDMWSGSTLNGKTETQLTIIADESKSFTATFVDNGTCTTPTDLVYPKDCGAAQNMKVDGKIVVGATTVSKTEISSNSAVINGTVKAREVIVTNKNWPDYVFKNGYKLNTLSEVESYIDQHGHLPNVPSEAEVETNGFNVSSMQGVMLEKIEEMTLYIIELEKRVNELEAK